MMVTVPRRLRFTKGQTTALGVAILLARSELMARSRFANRMRGFALEQRETQPDEAIFLGCAAIAAALFEG
jgi:IS4 transposase